MSFSISCEQVRNREILLYVRVSSLLPFLLSCHPLSSPSSLLPFLLSCHPLSPPPSHTHRLGGYPPFSDEITEYSLHDQICQGRYSFPPEFWKNVSDDAINLIKQLLTLDPKKRFTTVEALQHPWMQDDKVIAQAKKLMEDATGSKSSMSPPPNLVRALALFPGPPPSFLSLAVQLSQRQKA